MFLLDWFYGILASLGLWQKEAKILIFGDEYEYAQKANLLQMLKYGRLIPARHLPLEEFTVGKIKFKAFDLGWHQIASRVLRYYYAHAQVDAVVYLATVYNKRIFERSGGPVIDLKALLLDEPLINVPVLILGVCDREDLVRDNIVSFSRLEQHLMRDLKQFLFVECELNLVHRPINFFLCSFGLKRGYHDGFKWLSQCIK